MLGGNLGSVMYGDVSVMFMPSYKNALCVMRAYQQMTHSCDYGTYRPQLVKLFFKLFCWSDHSVHVCKGSDLRMPLTVFADCV